MNRRNFLAAAVAATGAAALPAVGACDCECLPSPESLEITYSPATDCCGGFIIPREFEATICAMGRDGKVLFSEPVTVRQDVKSIEEVCRLRGVPYFKNAECLPIR